MSDSEQGSQQEKDLSNAAEGGGGVRALERGLQLVKCFDIQHPSWRIADLARKVGLHKATARRLVKTLETESFLELDPNSGEYRLGSGLLPVAYLIRSHEEVARVAHPFLERLAADTGETVGLFVWAGDGIMLADHVQTAHLFKPPLVPGAVSTTYGTAHSKILLAFGPEERLSRLSFDQHGPGLSLGHAAKVQEELKRVRDSGIAYEIEERAADVCAVGVPIRDDSGQVMASLSVVAPTERFGPAQKEYISTQLRTAAQAISAKLGFRG